MVVLSMINENFIVDLRDSSYQKLSSFPGSLHHYTSFYVDHWSNRLFMINLRNSEGNHCLSSYLDLTSLEWTTLPNVDHKQSHSFCFMTEDRRYLYVAAMYEVQRLKLDGP